MHPKPKKALIGFEKSSTTINTTRLMAAIFQWQICVKIYSARAYNAMNPKAIQVHFISKVYSRI